MVVETTSGFTGVTWSPVWHCYIPWRHDQPCIHTSTIREEASLIAHSPSPLERRRARRIMLDSPS